MLIRTIKRSLASTTALLLGLIAAAQGSYPMTINPVILPPYSPSIATYFSSQTNVAFIISNSTSTTYQVYLAGSVRSVPNEEISATVEGGQPWSAPPLIVTPGSNYFTGETLQPILNAINGNPATIVGLDEEQLRLGVIPEGEYELCLKVYDYTSPETQLSELGCVGFSIREGEPPVPLTPTCWDDGTGEMVTPQTPQFINFNWILPGGIPPGVTISYAFRLVRIDNPSNAQAALETSTDVVYEDLVMMNQLSYTQMMPALEPGRMYAWWVRAIPFPESAMVFRNDGYMRPCTFTYAEHSGTAFSLTFPLQQDTLPWDLMPIMARFEPHAPPDDERTTGKFWSRLDLYQDAAFLNTTFRHTQSNEIDWAQGYYRSQLELLDEPPDFTEEQARHINIYTNNPTPDGRFKRGSSYALSADLRIKDLAGMDARYGDVEGIFVSGMGKPKPQSPAPNAVIPKNGGDTLVSGFAPIRLRFQTAEPPMALRPPFPIRILYGSNAPTQTQGQAHERWRLEVSRSATMASPILTSSVELGPVQLLNDACDDNCFIDQFYSQDSVTFTPTDTGTYYWRVSWMKDPTSAVGETYHDGPVRMFRITGNPAPATPDEEPERPRECVTICRGARTPLEQQIPASTVIAGDTVKVGLFAMRVSQITWAGGSASGEGVIPVPFMNCPLRVSFTNVRINASKHLYDGEVLGLYDNESIVPAAWRTGGGLAAGFSPSTVENIDNYLNAAGRLVAQMSMNSPMGLPIGIATDVPGGRFTVGIVGMRFTDTVAVMNAMMSVPVPELGFNFGLGASEQVFHPDGVGCPERDALLYLVDDVRVGIGEDTLVVRSTRFEPGNYINVVDSGTFAAWDCRGFRALQLDAQWRFSSDHLREDMPNGDSGPSKIIASLKTRTGRGGFMGRVDFNKPFHIDGAEGWGFDVQEAWMDLASYANPPDMSFSAEVAQHVGLTDGSGAAVPAWRGFYLKRAMLRLPDQVKRFGSTERIAALVDDLAITGSQVTGSIKLASLILPDEGNLGGWSFSVDTLRLDIVMNSFHQAGMKGRMRTSVSPTLLDYSAIWQQSLSTSDHWIQFIIQPQDDLSVPFLFANINLEETSTVVATLGHAQLGSYAKATLNGSISITAPAAIPVSLSFADIEFENLWFGTQAPYTNIDSSAVFSLASPQKWMGSEEDDDMPTVPGGSAGGFPVSITRVTGERTTIDGKPAAGIAYDINLKLTGTTNIFIATTRVATLGVLNTSNIHQWGDHEMRLDSIGVTGGTGAVHIEGGLKWYRDSPTYGNGIKGGLRARFLNGKVDVEANAQFGTTGGNKYWYVDAMAAKQGGFNRPSAFTVYGFGGAAWYHMRKTSEPPGASVIMEQELANLPDPDFEPGLTVSGMTFVPDASIGFGFKATVVFGDPSSGYAYNGDLSAGAQFASEGGIQSLFLEGDLFVMHKREEEGRVPIRGHMEMEYDFAEDVFTARAEMFVDVGPNVVYGLGANKSAGELELYIGPENWHLYIGTPQARVGLQFVDLFSGNFYFMVGDDIPGVPDPPAALLDVMPASYRSRPDISNASGIAFGASVPFASRGDFLLFRYALNGDIGFDVLFRSSEEMQCEGIDDPGIGPFYANGQVYGYVNASVSLYVDVRFFSGEYHLFSIGVSGLFQCGFANPTWARGFAHGNYSILHGAISGSATVPFFIGEACLPPGGDVLAGLDPIGDLVPHHLEGLLPTCSNAAVCGVDCGAEPEAIFNMKAETPFEVKEQLSNGSFKTHTFRLRIETFRLAKASGNVTVACSNPEFNSAKDRVSIRPTAYLEPTIEYTCTLKVAAEKLDANGMWQPARNSDNQAVTWQKIHRFKTNTGIEELRPEDVDVSYPFYRQRYLLQDECRSGIIICKSDISDQPVFKAPPGRRRVFRAVFMPVTGGTPVERTAQVTHGGQTRIAFAIPPLVNSRTYALRIVARDEIDLSTMGIAVGSPAASGGGSTSPFATPITSGVAVASAGSTSLANGMVLLRRQVLQGYTLRADERITYIYHFRTSGFSTLSAKLASLTNAATTRTSSVTNPVQEYLLPAFSGERFDAYDLVGFTYGLQGSITQPPLITAVDANTDTWMKNWAKPLIYDYYAAIKAANCSDEDLERLRTVISNGFFTRTIISDSPDNIGMPPYRTVAINPYYTPDPQLTASETSPYSLPIGMGVNSSTAGGTVAPTPLYKVGTGKQVAMDYARMQTITADVIATCGPVNPVVDGQGEDMGGMPEPLRSKVQAFQASSYKLLYKGNYGLKHTFRLPLACGAFVGEPGTVAPTGTIGTLIYNHPTGPNPPIGISPAGPLGPGSGTIQY